MDALLVRKYSPFSQVHPRRVKEIRRPSSSRGKPETGGKGYKMTWGGSEQNSNLRGVLKKEDAF